MNEWRRTYGKFSLRGYVIHTFGTLFLTFLSIFCFFYLHEYVYSIICFGISLVLFYLIFAPYKEKYRFNGNCIEIKKGDYTEQINLPTNFCFILSETFYNPGTTQSFHMKGKVMLNIVKGDQVNVILEKLHSNKKIKYANTTLPLIFNEDYIYSFVCDSDMLFELQTEFPAPFIIVLESILNDIPAEIRENTFVF